MRRRRRHVLAALGAAVAVVLGTVTAPGAAAAGVAEWPAEDGKLMFVNSSRGVMQTHQLGSGTYTDFAAGMDPAWSPDGSRVAYQVGDEVHMRRYTGSTLVEIPNRDTSLTVGDPTFLYGGDTIVYTLDGRLHYAPSDGSQYGRLLFSPPNGCHRQPSGSLNGLVAYMRSDDGCDVENAEIWLYDDSTGEVRELADVGETPAISPDGTQVAFVRDGGLFLINVDGTGERQIPLSGDASDPAWSPSGTRIAVGDGARTGIRVLDVATGEVTPVPLPPGTSAIRDAAWQPLREQGTGRVWGADVYGSNLAASRWRWNTVGQSEPGMMDAKTAVLISKDSPSYALTGQSLAGQRQGPLLMTSETSLSAAVQTELRRTLKPGSTVYLVGGTDFLSSAVESAVRSLGFTPKRLAGTSRYSTSVAVAKAVTSAPEYVFLATGTDYHSALAASAAAGALGLGGKGTVVLNEGNTLTSSVTSYLNSVDPDETMVIPVGTTAEYALTHTALPNWPESWYYYPINGSGHDGTSVALARFWWSSPGVVGLAWTESWRGGATAGAGMLGYGPILWTDDAPLTETDATYLRQQAAGTHHVIAFGGSTSVSPEALAAAGSAISASSSLVTYTPYYDGLSPAERSHRALGAPGVGAPKAAAPGPNPDAVRTANR